LTLTDSSARKAQPHHLRHGSCRHQRTQRHALHPGLAPPCAAAPSHAVARSLRAHNTGAQKHAHLHCAIHTLHLAPSTHAAVFKHTTYPPL
jgi:hypothetical protein